jgi:hypothetical protein
MAELQIEASQLLEALHDAEVALAILREDLAAKQAALDVDERKVVRLEQLITTLRSRLYALPTP